jgi:fatty acid desaturase
MKLSIVFFAVSVLARIQEWGASRSGSLEFWIFLGALLVIALGAFFWAVNFRKHRRHHRHHHHRQRSPPEPQPQEETGKGKSGGLFSRHRRRRKKKRRANPTLADIGGLPEPRDPQKPPTV